MSVVNPQPSPAKFCASCRGIFPIEATVCDRDGSPLVQVEQVLAGRYVLKSVIGSGNMGTVYRATQLPMGRDVAVKLMHTDLVRNPDLVERFEREAQAAATVDHPNAITVFDSGRTSDGQVYISMELLEGESLSAMIDRETQIPPERALELWIPVVKAMVVAHRKGVIHRDQTRPLCQSRGTERAGRGKGRKKRPGCAWQRCQRGLVAQVCAWQRCQRGLVAQKCAWQPERHPEFAQKCAWQPKRHLGFASNRAWQPGKSP